jgi:hypothetical protein
MKDIKKPIFLSFLLFVLVLSFFQLKNIIAQSSTFEIKLNPGWNWISFPFTEAQINYKNSDCYFLYPYAQYFNSTTQKLSDLNLKTASNLGGLGLRLYSFDNCTLKIDGKGEYKPPEIYLSKGYNLIAIPYGGIDLINLKGCKINFVRYYNSSDRKWYQWEPVWGKGLTYLTFNNTVKMWQKVTEVESFRLPAGISILINVNENCNLSFGAPQSSPPQTTTTSTSSISTTTTTGGGGGGRGGGLLPM